MCKPILVIGFAGANPQAAQLKHFYLVALIPSQKITIAWFYYRAQAQRPFVRFRVLK